VNARTGGPSFRRAVYFVLLRADLTSFVMVDSIKKFESQNSYNWNCKTANSRLRPPRVVSPRGPVVVRLAEMASLNVKQPIHS
jgi:hypothetical protein